VKRFSTTWKLARVLSLSLAPRSVAADFDLLHRPVYELYTILRCCLASTGFLFLLAASALAASDGQPAPTSAKSVARLFILSGQSNAGGAGIGSELPEDLRKNDDRLLMFGRHVRGLQPLAPYRRRGFGDDDTAFGAELVFGHRIRKAFPNDVICVAKQTTGGCSIIAWDKDWKRKEWLDELKLVDNVQKGAQYPLLMETIRGAVEALKTRDDVGRVEYSGMIWIQSERDDHHPRAAEMYEQNLRKLIANVRADLHAPDLPFLFADANVRRHREAMQAGMRRIAREVPRTAVVSIEGLSKRGAVHYDTQGQIELGRRFADEYLRVTGKN
jgi:hypothetical protein